MDLIEIFKYLIPVWLTASLSGRLPNPVSCDYGQSGRLTANRLLHSHRQHIRATICRRRGRLKTIIVRQKVPSPTAYSLTPLVSWPPSCGSDPHRCRWGVAAVDGDTDIHIDIAIEQWWWIWMVNGQLIGDVCGAFSIGYCPNHGHCKFQLICPALWTLWHIMKR